MESNKIKSLQNLILEAVKNSAIKIIETKKLNQQKIAVSVNGEIKVITPQ